MATSYAFDRFLRYEELTTWLRETAAAHPELLTVESRLGRIGRTSFTLEHRITASASARGEARLGATAEAVQVLYDYATNRPRRLPDEIVGRLEAFEGRALRATG